MNDGVMKVLEMRSIDPFCNNGFQPVDKRNSLKRRAVGSVHIVIVENTGFEPVTFPMHREAQTN